MSAGKTALWISGATVVVSLLGIVPAYVVFFDKPDLVYEMHTERIPLPSSLRGQLPDSLVIATIKNVGHRPSTDMQANLAVTGELIDYQVEGPNPAYGVVSHSRKDLQISINCPRLAPGDYPIKVSAWYRVANSGPDIGVADSTGPGRRVDSIAVEKSRYKTVGSGLIGILVGSLGSFVAIAGAFRLYKLRRSISQAAQQLRQDVEQAEVGEAGEAETR